MFDSIRFAVPVLFMMVCLCSCVRREITQEEKAELTRKVASIYEKTTRNKEDFSEKEIDDLLSFCRKVKLDDTILFSISFAKNLKGYSFYLRGDKVTAEKYYSAAIKDADCIASPPAYRVVAKSLIYLNLIELHKGLPEMMEKDTARWQALFQEDSDAAYGSSESREVILMYHGFCIDMKANILVMHNKLDEAEMTIKNFLTFISKKFADPSDYVFILPLYDGLVEIYCKKNDIAQMNQWIGKSIQMAEKWHLFPENSFYCLIDLHLKQGKYSDAIEHCKKGLAFCNKDSHVRRTNDKIRLLIFLAEAYHKSGDQKNAEKILNRAESMDPPPDLMKKIKLSRKRMR